MTRQGFYPLGQCRQMIEHRCQFGLIGLAGGRQRQIVGIAQEQLNVEALFQETNHPADCRRGDVQLIGCLDETAASRRRFKSPDPVE